MTQHFTKSCALVGKIRNCSLVKINHLIFSDSTLCKHCQGSSMNQIFWFAWLRLACFTNSCAFTSWDWLQTHLRVLPPKDIYQNRWDHWTYFICCNILSDTNRTSLMVMKELCHNSHCITLKISFITHK